MDIRISEKRDQSLEKLKNSFKGLDLIHHWIIMPKQEKSTRKF